MKTRKMHLPTGWYPHSKMEIEEEIQSFLKNFEQPDVKNPLGGLIPHAGWYFSGKLACRVISTLKNAYPDTIILFGGHLGVDKPILYQYTELDTPLGPIHCDVELIEKLSEYCHHESEMSSDNTVEIQLPFIKYFFPDAKICAFRSPSTNEAIKLGEKCAELTKKLNRNAVFIGSLDLTHYGPRYGFAPKGIAKDSFEWVKNVNDKGFIDKVLDLDAEAAIKHAINNQSSCSPGAAASVIGAVKTLSTSPNAMLVDYYTSADIMKDTNFVGYAGILFS